jgi:hypothetical protein
VKGNFLRKNLSREEAFIQGFFGFLPGFLSWALIALVVYFSITSPLAGAGIVIAFSFYWLLRTLYAVFFLQKARRRILVDKEHADWSARARGLDNVDEYLRGLYYGNPPEKNTPQDYSLSLHKAEIRDLRKTKNMPAKYDSFYHCVIIPLEDLEHGNFEACVESLRLGSFPAKRVMLLFTTQEPLASQLKSYVAGLDPDHRKAFHDIKVIGGSREPGAKGINKAHLINQAAGLAGIFFQKQGIPPEAVIVSYFDGPRALDNDYLSVLTYSYMVHPHREYVCFQPIPLFSENLGSTAPYLRGFELGSSFLELINTTSPMYLRRFYGNSLGLPLLARLGYLPEDVVSYSQGFSILARGDKSAIFEVVPLPVTIKADFLPPAREIKTMGHLRRRNQAFACSVEGFSYLMRLFLTDKKAPILEKIKYSILFLEEAVIYSLWPFLLSLIGWLPLLSIGKEFTHPMFYFALGRVRLFLFIFTLGGFLAAAGAVFSLVFPESQGKKTSAVFRSSGVVFLGVGAGFFARAMANLKAQTTYMLGKYF